MLLGPCKAGPCPLYCGVPFFLLPTQHVPNALARRWNRHLNAQLRRCLPFFEEVRVRQQHVQLSSLPPLAQFTQSSELVAVPVATALTSSASLRSLVHSTRVWDTAARSAEIDQLALL